MTIIFCLCVDSTVLYLFWYLPIVVLAIFQWYYNTCGPHCLSPSLATVWRLYCFSCMQMTFAPAFILQCFQPWRERKLFFHNYFWPIWAKINLHSKLTLSQFLFSTILKNGKTKTLANLWILHRIAIYVAIGLPPLSRLNWFILINLNIFCLLFTIYLINWLI